MGLLLKLLIGAGLLYALLVLLLGALQERLLFPTYAVPRAGLIPTTSQRLKLQAADGVTLRGVHIPPSRPGAERLLTLIFAGNAWNAEDAADLVHHIWPEADVVAFHYRGYGPSEGRPTAAALLADAPKVLAAARSRVPDARTIAVGMSVGSGVAASLAGEVQGVLLVTPFDRLSLVAAGHYPWLPVRSVFRHEMDAAAALRETRTPVAILAAGEDRIIPPIRTDALRGAVANLVFDRTISGAGHNDLYARSDFQQAMDEALLALLRETASSRLAS